MASMYETIMDLPLFKGISVEKLSLMLEKTRVEFLNFVDQEIIAEPENRVKAIDFILKGQVCRETTLEASGIIIKEYMGEGAVIGGTKLYGISTNYDSRITSEGKTSVMRISKDQYLNILTSDNIFLINYLNYLSAAAQRYGAFLKRVKNFSFATMFQTIVMPIIYPRSERVVLTGSDESFATLAGKNITEWMEWKRKAESDKVIAVDGNNIILLKWHP